VLPDCRDKDPSCWQMPEANCRAPYVEWAKEYCPNRCKYCIGEYSKYNSFLVLHISRISSNGVLWFEIVSSFVVLEVSVRAKRICKIQHSPGCLNVKWIMNVFVFIFYKNTCIFYVASTCLRILYNEHM